MADSDSSMFRRPELAFEERQKIACGLISCSDGGRLMRGSIKKISVTNGCSAKTVSRIWERAREAQDDGITSVLSVVASKKHQSERKKIDRAGALRMLKNVPLNQRATIRACAYRANIPQTSMFRELGEGSIKRKRSRRDTGGNQHQLIFL